MVVKWRHGQMEAYRGRVPKSPRFWCQSTQNFTASSVATKKLLKWIFPSKNRLYLSIHLLNGGTAHYICFTWQIGSIFGAIRLRIFQRMQWCMLEWFCTCLHSCPGPGECGLWMVMELFPGDVGMWILSDCPARWARMCIGFMIARARGRAYRGRSAKTAQLHILQEIVVYLWFFANTKNRWKVELRCFGRAPSI